MSKPSLSFYTNMPTPYQLDFFEELAERFKLEVIYFTAIEKDRQWQLPLGNDKYEVTILQNNFIARWVQKKIMSFHFSWAIFSVALKNTSSFVVVNGTYWSPNVVITILISRLRSKKVFFYGEPLFPSKSIFRFWIKKNILLAPIKYSTHCLLAIGKLAVDSYTDYGYFRAIHNIPYNINIDTFAKATPETTEIGLEMIEFKKNGGTIFLTSGALIERKGIDIVINAFKQIKADSAVRLMIVGDGPNRAFLETLAAPFQNIIFLGFQEKDIIPSIFKNADIFVFASHYDGWGLVINEAIASYLTVICSDKVGAAVDKLKNGVNAIICNDNDINCYKRAMETCVSNIEFREELVNNNHLIREELSSRYNAKRLYVICNSIK